MRIRLWILSTWLTVMTGSATLPGCGDDKCKPGPMYGSEPCDSDDDCVNREEDGVDWYCDKKNTYDGGCGPFHWPICKPIDDGTTGGD